MPNPSNFDRIIEGKAVKLITLRNASGMAVWLTNFGARIVGAMVPDKIGRMRDVIPGFNSLDAYLNPNGIYMGALLSSHQTELGAVKFNFPASESPLPAGGFALPGNNGFGDFHQHIWDIDSYDKQFAQFSYSSENERSLTVWVTYTLTDNNTLKIVYKAETLKPVMLDATNLVWFNLNGEGSGSILRHNLKMKAGHYLPWFSEKLAANTYIGVGGSPFDFRRGRTFGSSIYDHHPQLFIGNGYDHDFIWENFYLNSIAAQVIGESGILLKVQTDRPVLHLDTGNQLSGKNLMRSGMPDLKHSMFTLVPKLLSQSHLLKNSLSNVVLPGEVYRRTTIYQFIVV